MKFLIVALAILSVCYAQSDDDWNRFQSKFGKSYRSADEISNRRAVWESNWKLIKQHNEEYAKGLHTYTLGENEFADMTFEEFSQQRLGLSAKVLKDIEENPNKHEMSGLRAEVAVDLRNEGIVSDVRNQGNCGSCWAFAAVATVEGAWARAKKVPPPDLSEQQLVDCSKGDSLTGTQGNFGCNGGWIDITYGDIIQTGLQSESSYAYAAVGGSCKYNANAVVARISGFKSINSEAQLVDAVSAGNLVDVAMYASSKFQLYSGGVYSSTAGEDRSRVNHAVTVVGYDSTPKSGYILVKNSWGARWGENGYFRVQYGKQALNIGSVGAYPVV